MYAYRKSDGAQFPCGSEDVCRIEHGSTNPFITEPRALEEFLKGIEPHYSAACSALLKGQFNLDDILVIAGFVSFIIGTSPTAMRLGAAYFERLTHTEIELMDRAGMLDDAPPELGGKSATELIQNGVLVVKTDAKFPQAMSISSILEQTKTFASFHWEILLNRNTERFPFLTSDYPAAIEGFGGQMPATRIIPLQPNLAIRILPQIRPIGSAKMANDFRYKIRKVSPIEVRTINLSIVRCAENLVFSPVEADWVALLVEKNANFQVELKHERVPKGTGYKLTNSMVVRAKCISG